MTLETSTGVIKPKINIESDQAIRQKIQAELAELGIPECPPEIINHLILLEKNSNFNDDSRSIIEGIKNVLELETSFKLRPIEKQRVILATYLSDIGKSHSLEVTKLFSVENIEDENQTVGETLQTYFPVEKEEMIANLRNVGVNSDMSMREFWDKHASWTKIILDKYTHLFDKETRIIAASHHLDHGINPYEINVNDIEQISNGEKFSIFLLMALDKYQALRRRSKKNHKEAMESLKVIFGQYDGDAIMRLIITTIDQLGATDSLFKE